MKKFFMNLRRYLIVLTTIFSYTFFVYSFYINWYWLMSTVFLLIFFMFLHYFIIELKKYSISYLFAIIITASLLETFMIWYWSFFKLVSLYVINFWIIILIMSVNDEINNRRYISSWNIFNSWVWIFSLFVAVSYSFMFVARYPTFNLTCDVLYTNLNLFIDTLATPWKLWVQQANTLRNSLNKFYNTKMQDLIWFSWDVSEHLSWLNLSGDLLSWVTISWNNISWVNDILTNLKTNKDTNNTTLFGKIENLRNDLIYQVLTDRKNMDKWMCNFVIDKIASVYGKPSFIFSIIVSLSLLLWSFIRIMMLFIWIINFLIFKIMIWTKIYNFQKIMDEVEEIV